MSRLRLALVACAMTVAASLMLAAGASARTHDRNHDRIPDRWEKRHHLSLAVDQARRDQDHDGLRNRGEFKAGLDPRDADSDDDGLEDADEHVGAIASFDGSRLVVSLAGGGTVSGLVTAATEIECEADDRSAAGASRAGDDEPSGEDPSGDDQGEDPSGDDEGDDAPGDDHGDDEGDDSGEDASGCGADALQPGTRVEEAELSVRGGTARFKELKLAA